MSRRRDPADPDLDGIDEFIRESDPVRLRLFRGKRKYGLAAGSSTVLWVYNFGDGSSLDYSPVPTASHTYAAGALYNATMTTQDKQGNVQTYSMSVDTTLAACAVAAVRGLAPPTFFGLFVAFLVASFVAAKKHPKWKRRLRVGAVVSLFIVVGAVVLL